MAIQKWQKILEIGRCTDDGVYVSTHVLGGSRGILPQSGALRYLYPTATSLTRILGRILPFAIILTTHHEAFQSM